MSETTYFQVIDGPLKVRSEPGGKLLKKQFKTGEILEAQSNSKKEVDGYVWWQHENGWSAEKAADDSDIFMRQISSEEAMTIKSRLESGAPATDLFVVTDGPLKVRQKPGGQLFNYEIDNEIVLRVDPKSRAEQGGYIWWKHSGGGWSAEKSINGRNVFMKPFFGKAEVYERPEPKKVEIPKHLKGEVFLQVARQTKVRNQPSTDPRGTIIRNIKRGEGLVVDMDTLTEADGFYWVKHELGWSAMQDVFGQMVFLGEPGTIPGLISIGPDGPDQEELPGYGELITRLPVDLDDIQWWQYFGNNVFSYVNGKKYGYDRYSQGLHGGQDYGNSARSGVKVYAGVHGKFIKADYARAKNYRVLIQVGEDYEFIYQHITNIRQFQEGQEITPDTVLAEIEHNSQGGWDHLHFEVRFMEDWIVNPLVLMTPELQQQLMDRFDPEKPNSDWGKTASDLNFFYRTDEWQKWTTALDQPVIRLAGPVAGPHSEGK